MLSWGGVMGYGIATEPVSGAERVLGSRDRRVKVSAPKDWPWRVHGHLELNFGPKSTYIGSGTLVGPKHVLTAGHCLYDHDSRDPSKSTPIKSASFYPGLSGTDVPWSAQGATMVVHPRYKNARMPGEQQESDIGIIILDRPLGTKLGYFGTREFADTDSIVHITGYPGDKGENKTRGREMYTMNGPITVKKPNRVFYDIDTYGGQSGSGAYTWSEERKEGTCVAVHAYGPSGGERYNSGTRLNSQTLSMVQTWMNTHQ